MLCATRPLGNSILTFLSLSLIVHALGAPVLTAGDVTPTSADTRADDSSEASGGSDLKDTTVSLDSSEDQFDGMHCIS